MVWYFAYIERKNTIILIIKDVISTANNIYNLLILDNSGMEVLDEPKMPLEKLLQGQRPVRDPA